MKRLLDFLLALCGLTLLAIPVIVMLVLVWQQDWRSPLYFGGRVGKDGRRFRMVKVRSMVVNADRSGVESTGATDDRITAIGHFVRRWKIDEVLQLWNVLVADMSLVGPRPNTVRGVEVYSEAEMRLLTVRPGITDIASIVFADEGDILADKADPDLAYNQLIRPYKSQLGLAYIDNRSALLDVQLIWLTAIAIISRESALRSVAGVLEGLNVSPELRRVAARQEPLQPAPPPGADEVVSSRGS